MTDIDTLKALRERVRSASGPNRELDADVMAGCFDWAKREAPYLFPHCIGDEPIYWHAPEPYRKRPVPELSGSVDAALAIVERLLPGWAWKLGTCSVSDDAWLVPDFNCPTHGGRLREQFAGFEYGSVWDIGFDIDRRPPGQPALAVIEALLDALIAIAELEGAAAKEVAS